MFGSASTASPFGARSGGIFGTNNTTSNNINTSSLTTNTQNKTKDIEVIYFFFTNLFLRFLNPQKTLFRR